MDMKMIIALVVVGACLDVLGNITFLRAAKKRNEGENASPIKGAAMMTLGLALLIAGFLGYMYM